MAETKLIPFDLKALLVSHLFGPYRRQAFGMTSTGVIPLELAEVRKTQRRVAALLNLPFNGHCFCLKRGHLFSSDVCYFCSQLKSYRHVAGDRGRHRKCPHAPPVPQNSFLLEDDTKEDVGLKANLFDTTIFKEGTDPLGFKLPPVFSKNAESPGHGQGQNGDIMAEGRRRDRKKKIPRSRIVPTVSEKTFLNSNLRDSDMDVDAGFYDNDSNYEEDFYYEEEADDISKAKVSLPKIRSGQSNLVTSSWNGEEHDGKSGSRDGVSMTSRSEPVMERTTTLDREKTGASLRIDEDYVPMSVFIKQVADSQANGLTESLHRYDEDISSSISGSLGVSRETSLGDSDHSQISLSNYCTCLDPMTDELPCTECLHPHAHERWCTRRHESNERNRMCLVCGKLIRPMKSKKRERPEHRKHGRSGDRRDSRYRQTPDTLMTNSWEQIHDRATCSGKKRNGGGSQKTSKSSIDRPNPAELHVRFDDQVKAVSPDYGNGLNYNHAPPESKLEEGSKQSPVFKSRRHPKPDMKIPKLGVNVNVHKMAYDLALSDARATDAYKRKGKKKKKERIGSEKLTGTVFSYFPLLKARRPLSEGEAPQQIGVTQDEGRRVAPKNYMKHIFGNIKLADYYPGGSKWRPMD